MELNLYQVIGELYVQTLSKEMERSAFEQKLRLLELQSPQPTLEVLGEPDED